MFSFLKGRAVGINLNTLVLEINGVGFEILMSDIGISSIDLGADVLVYTRMNVSEDEISLCGFTSLEERELFDALVTVSGIGKKSALKILSASSSDSIITLIVGENLAGLSKLPGIGKKTAERLVVELRDKFKKQYGELRDGDEGVSTQPAATEANEDIMLALNGLGFSRTEVLQMLQGVTEDMTIEEAVKFALKNRR